MSSKKTNQRVKEVSVASLVIGLLHVIQIFVLDSPNKEPTPFQGKSTIVFKDSVSGKMDTMDLETYIKQQEKK